MSIYDNPDPIDDPPVFDTPRGEGKKAGMSTGLKVLLVILGVMGGMFLLCCGGLVYFWSQAFQFDDDPAAAKAMTAELANIEIPSQFTPVGSMTINAWVMKMRGAIYQPDGDPQDGTLVLFQIDMPGQDPAAQQAQMRESMQQSGQGAKNLDVASTESRPFEIDGQQVEFQFVEGKDQQSKREFKQVMGLFPGKSGGVFLLLQVPKDQYDEAAVVKMLESLKDQGHGPPARADDQLAE